VGGVDPPRFLQGRRTVSETRGVGEFCTKAGGKKKRKRGNTVVLERTGNSFGIGGGRINGRETATEKNLCGGKSGRKGEKRIAAGKKGGKKNKTS